MFYSILNKIYFNFIYRETYIGKPNFTLLPLPFICARYRETKVQALMCAQSAPITRICAQSVSFADTISACPLWPLPLYALASLARGDSRALYPISPRIHEKYLIQKNILNILSFFSFYWKIKVFGIIFMKGCWEDLTKKHVFISRRETSRVSGIHLYDTLYALASLARGDSRAL